MSIQYGGEHLLKLSAVLARFPVSRSTWYSGVKAGAYPTPVKLGPRAVAWRATDIAELIERRVKGEGEHDDL